ncbi:MAG: adenosylcobinamide-GDP ribazoletransferase [Alphaproteobacteria bacterium]|nr:adenosylcobinamide-GDP ribazoletransferase [Alphaproteobacteria bacterium]
MSGITLGPSIAVRIVEVARQAGLAIVFLTRGALPPALISHQPLRHAVWAFPLVGAGIGTMGAVVFWGTLLIGGHDRIAALLAIVTAVLMTGALHEDGLADICDAMGTTDASKRYDILHDPRIGTYGMLGLLLVVLAKWEMLATLAGSSFTQVLYSFVVMEMISRWAMTVAMREMPPAAVNEETQLKRSLSINAGRPSVLVLVLGLGSIVLLLTGLGMHNSWYPPQTGEQILSNRDMVLLMLGVHLLLFLVVVLPFLRQRVRIWGGANGDTYGFTQQVVQCITLAVVIFAEEPISNLLARVLTP